MKFKGTRGEGSIKDGHVYFGDELVALSASYKKVDETLINGESWLSMRVRTKPIRECNSQIRKNDISLLAAAPELLEALLSMRIILNGFKKLDKSTIGYKAQVKAFKAINKALGES